jgi:hypothetical protein
VPAPHGQVVRKTIVNLDKSPVPLVFGVQARHTSARAMRLNFRAFWQPPNRVVAAEWPREVARTQKSKRIASRRNRRS